MRLPPAKVQGLVALLKWGAVGALGGCARYNVSAVPTSEHSLAAYIGPVKTVAVNVPRGAQPIALVQAVGQETLEVLVDGFTKRVGEAGGNLAVVESVRSKFELVSRSESYSYSCGTTTAPRTCNGTRQVLVEVVTTQVDGRAFRVKEIP